MTDRGRQTLRERQTDVAERDRQTDGQTDREETEADRQTLRGRESETETDRH